MHHALENEHPRIVDWAKCADVMWNVMKEVEHKHLHRKSQERFTKLAIHYNIHGSTRLDSGSRDAQQTSTKLVDDEVII